MTSKQIRDLVCHKSSLLAKNQLKEACALGQELAVKYMQSHHYEEAMTEFRELIQTWNNIGGCHRLDVAKAHRSVSRSVV